jgi:2-oxo-3-hexenedioate decarboxylase
MNLDGCAMELKAAQDERRQVAPFTTRFAGFDNAAAYEVARRIHERRVAEGDRPVGRKIGFTNRFIWDEYGVHEPMWGYVYERTLVRAQGQAVRAGIASYCEPRLEPEIVLCMRAVPREGAGPEEILACVDWIAHGFEIVQTHYPGWVFRAPDTMADNGLHGGLFVGEPRDPATLGPDLLRRQEEFTISLSCNTALREQGRGSNVLGSPVAALRFLLDVLARGAHGQRLRAGEIVTTGTLTRACPVKPGERWQTALEGLDLPGMTIEFDP